MARAARTHNTSHKYGHARFNVVTFTPTGGERLRSRSCSKRPRTCECGLKPDVNRGKLCPDGVREAGR